MSHWGVTNTWGGSRLQFLLSVSGYFLNSPGLQSAHGSVGTVHSTSSEPFYVFAQFQNATGILRRVSEPNNAVGARALGLPCTDSTGEILRRAVTKWVSLGRRCLSTPEPRPATASENSVRPGSKFSPSSPM